MKNKVLKKSLVLIISFITLSIGINFILYKSYINKVNNNILNIVGLIKDKYPAISDYEILSILNDKHSHNYDLSQYGINNDDLFMLENTKSSYQFLIISNVSIIIVLGASFLHIFLVYIKKRKNKVNDITQYIKAINQKKYELRLDENIEDELSILQNELYKITILLKEQSENAIEDKKNIKDNLSDISHQLKTPLTSISILLDNLIANDNMNEEVRKEFLSDIKKQVDSINFLIISLLKLSRFDANVIKFSREKINIKKLITEINTDLKYMSSQKNIKIDVLGDNNISFIGDYKWEKEALTNIIKNGIENLDNNGIIKITFKRLSIYTELVIEDNGKGIDNSDVKHIFKRFYKGKNSKEDSIGIGLSLSKKIIEMDNGYIKVDSKVGKGTKFTIKYLSS